MKKYLFLPFLLTGFCGAAQSYKIVISYDANGNRVKREQVCIGCSGTLSATVAMAPAQWQVYPNPGARFFTVALSAALLDGKGKLTVSDMTGRTLFERPVTATQTTIDLSAYADGTYTFTFSNSTQKLSQKVVKVY